MADETLIPDPYSYNEDTQYTALKFLNQVETADQISEQSRHDGLPSSWFAIGETIANRIMDRRKELGGEFARFDQLKSIDGLVDSKLYYFLTSFEMNRTTDPIISPPPPTDPIETESPIKLNNPIDVGPGGPGGPRTGGPILIGNPLPSTIYPTVKVKVRQYGDNQENDTTFVRASFPEGFDDWKIKSNLPLRASRDGSFMVSYLPDKFAKAPTAPLRIEGFSAGMIYQWRVTVWVSRDFRKMRDVLVYQN